MKAVTPISILILLIVSFSKGQSQTYRDTIPFKIQADFKLQYLDKSYITTGILYDRVFPIATIDESR